MAPVGLGVSLRPLGEVEIKKGLDILKPDGDVTMGKKKKGDSTDEEGRKVKNVRRRTSEEEEVEARRKDGPRGRRTHHMEGV